jgi:hypothetical protein
MPFWRGAGVHKDSMDWRRPVMRMDTHETGPGNPPLTPLGHPVESRHDALSERIREDLRAYGREALYPPSAYRLQALYLDFGRTAPREHLVESVLRALDAPREAAAPAASEPRLQEAERQAFGDLDDEDATRMGERAAGMPPRALVTALVFNAHFWNVRLALEVVGGRKPLERVALGTCAFVAERRIGRSLGGELRYYAPIRERRQAFCADHCLPAIGARPSDDRPCLPPRTQVDCGMLRILEGFRFFASFPEE